MMAAITPFFFFQAEDGIRGLYVTGVQTCALPISVPPGSRVATTSRPSAASASASSRACVDLPEPSSPSKVTNTAGLGYEPLRAIVTEIGRASCRERGDEDVVLVIVNRHDDNK